MRASDRSAIAVTISMMLASFTVTPLTQDSGFIGLSWVLIIAIGAASLATATHSVDQQRGAQRSRSRSYCSIRWASASSPSSRR